MRLYITDKRVTLGLDISFLCDGDIRRQAPIVADGDIFFCADFRRRTRASAVCRVSNVDATPTGVVRAFTAYATGYDDFRLHAAVYFTNGNPYIYATSPTLSVVPAQRARS